MELFATHAHTHTRRHWHIRAHTQSKICKHNRMKPGQLACTHILADPAPPWLPLASFAKNMCDALYVLSEFMFAANVSAAGPTHNTPSERGKSEGVRLNLCLAIDNIWGKVQQSAQLQNRLIASPNYGPKGVGEGDLLLRVSQILS